MLCEYFSLPCFVLTQIWDNLIELNSTVRLSCQQRCDSIGLDIPSYSRLEKSDWTHIYSLCEEEFTRTKTLADHADKVCTFPVKTKYSFDESEWLDGDTNKILNLPWKKPESTMGPFYPVLDDVLWLGYRDVAGIHYKSGLLWDGFRFLLYDSKRCVNFNKYYDSVKHHINYSQRHHHERILSKDDNICRELSFYCVNLKTNEISGPWEGAS